MQSAEAVVKSSGHGDAHPPFHLTNDISIEHDCTVESIGTAVSADSCLAVPKEHANLIIVGITTLEE